MTEKERRRCGWVPLDKPDYVTYHDEEWGVPSHADRRLFEMLILEGAQAGLSWYTILRRRDGYRKAFKNFDPRRVARMTDGELEKVLKTENIIRNRSKVFSVRKNAQAFLDIQKEFGSFDSYLSNFVGKRTRTPRPKTLSDVPYSIPAAKMLARDLKKRGMSFVGEGIIYAYMQATGMVDDHIAGCYRANKGKNS